MPSQRTSPARIRSRERTQLAVQMRVEGATYAEIGEALGVTFQAAHKVVARALREWTAQIEGGARELVTLELARLDALHAALWSTAVNGDLAAIDRIIKLMERRSRLLGLDAQSAEQAEPVVRVVIEDSSEGWGWAQPELTPAGVTTR